MAKFALGVAVGYLFSDVIEEMIKRATSNGMKMAESTPTPPSSQTTSTPTEENPSL